MRLLQPRGWSADTSRVPLRPVLCTAFVVLVLAASPAATSGQALAAQPVLKPELTGLLARTSLLDREDPVAAPERGIIAGYALTVS